MKKILVSLLFYLTITPIFGQLKINCSDKVSDSKLYKLPHSNFYSKNIEVFDQEIFLSIGGGIFLPKDSIWILKPSINRQIISFAINHTDSSLIVLQKIDTLLELTIIKLKQNSSSEKLSKKICTIEKGNYSLFYKNSTLFVWGYSNGNYKIGSLNNGKIVWLLSMNKKITAIDLDYRNHLLLSMNNKIVDYNDSKVLVKCDTTIQGFSCITDGTYLISCSSGLYKCQKGNSILIANGLFGALRFLRNEIYLLSTSKSYLWCLKIKQ